jgi:hypothetical protein
MVDRDDSIRSMWGWAPGAILVIGILAAVLVPSGWKCPEGMQLRDPAPPAPVAPTCTRPDAPFVDQFSEPSVLAQRDTRIGARVGIVGAGIAMAIVVWRTAAPRTSGSRTNQHGSRE